MCNLRDVTDLRTAQHDIAATARRFEAMLANLTDMISVIDAEGKMTYVSPAAEMLHGRRAEDRIGANIFEYIHPDDTELRSRRSSARRSPNPGLLAPFEARVRHDDGTYRTFEVKANNLLDDPGGERDHRELPRHHRSRRGRTARSGKTSGTTEPSSRPPTKASGSSTPTPSRRSSTVV